MQSYGARTERNEMSNRIYNFYIMGTEIWKRGFNKIEKDESSRRRAAYEKKTYSDQACYVDKGLQTMMVAPRRTWRTI